MKNLNRRTAMKVMAVGAAAAVVPVTVSASTPSIVVMEVIIEKTNYIFGVHEGIVRSNRGPVKLVGGPFDGTVHDIPKICSSDNNRLKKYDLHSLVLKDEKSDDQRSHSYASNKDGKTARYEGPVRYL